MKVPSYNINLTIISYDFTLINVAKYGYYEDVYDWAIIISFILHKLNYKNCEVTTCQTLNITFVTGEF